RATRHTHRRMVSRGEFWHAGADSGHADWLDGGSPAQGRHATHRPRWPIVARVGDRRRATPGRIRAGGHGRQRPHGDARVVAMAPRRDRIAGPRVPGGPEYL